VYDPSLLHCLELMSFLVIFATLLSIFVLDFNGSVQYFSVAADLTK